MKISSAIESQKRVWANQHIEVPYRDCGAQNAT